MLSPRFAVSFVGAGKVLTRKLMIEAPIHAFTYIGDTIYIYNDTNAEHVNYNSVIYIIIITTCSICHPSKEFISMNTFTYFADSIVQVVNCS